MTVREPEPEPEPERKRVIVALDVETEAQARTIVAALGDAARAYKIGLQLLTAAGPGLMRETAAAGKCVFLDLKLYKIPNSVGHKCPFGLSLSKPFLRRAQDDREDKLRANGSF